MTATPFNGDPTVSRLAAFFAERTGQRLSESRLWRMDVSLRPVMRAHGISSRAELVEVVNADATGPVAQSTLHALLNHETSFFRDPQLFDSLEHGVLPDIHRRKAAQDRHLRIWCAGVASGQEAYSLAMILKRMAGLWEGWRVTLVATDVSPLSIEAARAGIFSQIELQRGLPINELLRWFVPQRDDWVVGSELRDMITFQTANLLDAGSVGGSFDLVLCRNVLLYFGPDARAAALRHLRDRCAPGGYLVLGAGEVVQERELFQPSGTFRLAYRAGGPSR